MLFPKSWKKLFIRVCSPILIAAKLYQNSCSVSAPTILRLRDGNRSGRPAPVGSTGRSGRPAPVGSTGTGRVDRPVGSRFFDRPVKPVEKPVKFSFLATKRHLSTNRNILIYFIINKTFYKKSVLTNHTFRKHLLNGFKL